LTSQEEQQLSELHVLLSDFFLNPNNADRWCWLPDVARIFSVNSCYNVLIKQGSLDVIHSNVLWLLRNFGRMIYRQK
jgi:hypothetical protein